MEIPMITIQEYNEIVADKEKCFLIFTKQKCSVCARLIPTMQKIADEYAGNPEMHFYNMEIHDPDARALFKSWNLVGVPQTCIINNGEFQEALPGALDPNIYRDEINKLLGIQKKGFGAKLKSLFGGK
ncbi:MAG: thioredoxin family protein [Peptococcaceae bacterium]|nr:thioredoxin family protein [Peptococcaceae bacterium]